MLYSNYSTYNSLKISELYFCHVLKKNALLVYDKYDFRKEVRIDITDNELIPNNTSSGNYVFGRKYEYRIELTANDNNLSYYQTPRKHIEGEFYRGEQFEVNDYKKFLYNELLDKLYALSINESGLVYIDELNSNTLALIDRNFITNSNNTVGDFSYGLNKNFIVDLNSKSIEVDSNSFLIIKEHHITEFDSSVLKPSTIVRFRENTFAIDDSENQSYVSVYDIPSKSLILQKFKLRSDAFNISDDGNYFNMENKVYRKNNNSISIVYADEFHSQLFTDYQTNINKVYVAYGYVREIDLLTSSINQIPNHSNIHRIDYIPSQNKILSLHPGLYLVFYDLNSNQTNRKRIEIQGDVYFYLAQKDFLISPNGYVLKNYQ